MPIFMSPRYGPGPAYVPATLHVEFESALAYVFGPAEASYSNPLDFAAVLLAASKNEAPVDVEVTAEAQELLQAIYNFRQIFLSAQNLEHYLQAMSAAVRQEAELLEECSKDPKALESPANYVYELLARFEVRNISEQMVARCIVMMHKYNDEIAISDALTVQAAEQSMPEVEVVATLKRRYEAAAEAGNKKVSITQHKLVRLEVIYEEDCKHYGYDLLNTAGDYYDNLWAFNIQYMFALAHDNGLQESLASVKDNYLEDLILEYGGDFPRMIIECPERSNSLPAKKTFAYFISQARPQLIDNLSFELLKRAIETDDTQRVQRYLEEGAKADAKNSDDTLTPIDVCILHDKPEVANLLLAKMAEKLDVAGECVKAADIKTFTEAMDKVKAAGWTIEEGITNRADDYATAKTRSWVEVVSDQQEREEEEVMSPW
jgi:hypothetical protein